MLEIYFMFTVELRTNILVLFKYIQISNFQVLTMQLIVGLQIEKYKIQAIIKFAVDIIKKDYLLTINILEYLTLMVILCNY